MSKHVVIIGAGITGLCIADHCLRRGCRVTVIERLPQQRDGCSYGNAGMIVPSHFVPLAAPGMVKLGLKWMWNPESPFYVKPRLSPGLLKWGWKFWKAATREHVERCAPVLRDLSLASRALYGEMDAGADFGLVKKGLLMLCKTPRALEEEAHMAEQARKLGIPAEICDARQTAALDSGITMDVAGAVYFPQDCHLSPARLMDRLEKDALTRGATFLWNTEVTGLVTEGRSLKAVRTAAGDIAVDEVVLAAGVWSEGTARDLGLKLPMQAGKGYSLTVPAPRQLPELCSILTEARVAVTPMDGALRFGGTMEIAGLDESITARRVQGIIKAAVNYFPEFRPADFDGIPPWRGLRPCSPDGMPYLGRTAAWINLTVATGHAMMGLSLGPVTGSLTAEIIAGEKPAIDLSLLSPDRF